MRDLNEKEKKAIDLTVELWNQILELEEQHSSDRVELCAKIHEIQARIMCRPVRDEYKSH